MPREYSYGPREGREVNFNVLPQIINPVEKDIVNYLVTVSAALELKTPGKIDRRFVNNSPVASFAYTQFDAQQIVFGTGQPQNFYDTRIYPVLSRTCSVADSRGYSRGIHLFLVSENEEYSLEGPAFMAMRLPFQNHDPHIISPVSRPVRYNTVKWNEDFPVWTNLFKQAGCETPRETAALWLSHLAFFIETESYILLRYDADDINLITDAINEIYLFVRPQLRWRITFHSCVNAVAGFAPDYSSNEWKLYQPYNISGFVECKDTEQQDTEAINNFKQAIDERYGKSRCRIVDLRKKSAMFTKSLPITEETKTKYYRAINGEFSSEFDYKYPASYGFYPLEDLRARTISPDFIEYALNHYRQIKTQIDQYASRIKIDFKEINDLETNLEIKRQTQSTDLQSYIEQKTKLEEEKKALERENELLIEKQKACDVFRTQLAQYENIPEGKKAEVKKYFEFSERKDYSDVQRLCDFDDKIGEQERTILVKLREFHIFLDTHPEKKSFLVRLLKFQEEIENNDTLKTVEAFGREIKGDASVTAEDIKKWSRLLSSETQEKVVKCQQILDREKDLPQIQKKIEEETRLQNEVQAEKKSLEVQKAQHVAEVKRFNDDTTQKINSNLALINSIHSEIQKNEKELRSLLHQFFRESGVIEGYHKELTQKYETLQGDFEAAQGGWNGLLQRSQGDISRLQGEIKNLETNIQLLKKAIQGRLDDLQRLPVLLKSLENYKSDSVNLEERIENLESRTVPANMDFPPLAYNSPNAPSSQATPQRLKRLETHNTRVMIVCSVALIFALMSLIANGIQFSKLENKAELASLETKAEKTELASVNKQINSFENKLKNYNDNSMIFVTEMMNNMNNMDKENNETWDKGHNNDTLYKYIMKVIKISSDKAAAEAKKAEEEAKKKAEEEAKNRAKKKAEAEAKQAEEEAKAEEAKNAEEAKAKKSEEQSQATLQSPNTEPSKDEQSQDKQSNSSSELKGKKP